MIVSPLPWVHLPADWSAQGLDSYRVLRGQRRDGLHSVLPSVGRRSLAEENQMDAYFPISPFISSFMPFISFIWPFISSCLAFIFSFISPFISSFMPMPFMSLFISPFISSFMPFISPFILPISSANERELKPTRHMTAMTDNMIFFIEALLCDSER